MMCFCEIVHFSSGKDLTYLFFVHWQSQMTSSLFIDRLSDEYPEYIDVVQPVQVAIYEMKLGSSMILSSIFEEKSFKSFYNENRDRVMVLKNSSELL